MRRADSAQLDNGNTKTIQDYWLAKHFYFWIIGVFPMFWLLQQPNAPSISKKFAWCIISPVSYSAQVPTSQLGFRIRVLRVSQRISVGGKQEHMEMIPRLEVLIQMISRVRHLDLGGIEVL